MSVEIDHLDNNLITLLLLLLKLSIPLYPISNSFHLLVRDFFGLFQLSNNRSVTIHKFKGAPMVSVRQYYEKDGKQLPTLKGGHYALVSSFSLMVNLFFYYVSSVNFTPSSLPFPFFSFFTLFLATTVGSFFCLGLN